MRVSEIRVKQIRVNQGLGVYFSSLTTYLTLVNVVEKLTTNGIYSFTGP